MNMSTVHMSRSTTLQANASVTCIEGEEAACQPPAYLILHVRQLASERLAQSGK